jgi:hypothetical protein
MESTFTIILSKTILNLTIFYRKYKYYDTKLILLCHIAADRKETRTLDLSCSTERWKVSYRGK